MMRRTACPAAGLLFCLAAGPAGAQAPTLVPAALRGIAPAGAVRGTPVEFVLEGTSIRDATEAVFDDPAISGVPAPGANANQARVRATIGSAARAGVHRVYLHTPLGTTGAVTFAVGAWPEVPEGTAAAPGAGPTTLPVTFTGALQRPGEADLFPFRVEAGKEVVFQVIAAPIRSRLQSVLTLLDSAGVVLAESQGAGGSPDAVLSYRFQDAGSYAVRIRDWENAGGGDVTYRLNAGEFAHATHAFPLGVPPGGGEVTLYGPNLGEGRRVRAAGEPGAVATVRETADGPLLEPVRLAVGGDPEVTEQDAPHDTPATAQPIRLPVTINGRVSGEEKGGADCYRFTAQRGRPLVLEVNARRLGSPLDSVIEVLDAGGRPVERAALRCLAETALTLNDRDSATTGLRLLAWNDLAINDYVYVRGEVLQISALPRGPDDDVRFRGFRGQRLGFLDTTPTGHAVNTPVYKVRIHPPGTRFPPNGMPVFRVYYRNDDGGPAFGKDSRLFFTAPADGEYCIRIADVRGGGSPLHAYRLTAREARPGFRLTMSPEHPGVPAGASVPIEVQAERLDGYEGPIEARLEGLPQGITATSAVIEAGETSAALLLTAAPAAATATGRSALRLHGRGAGPAGEVTHVSAPAGGAARVTVLPRADLTVKTDRKRIEIVPGKEQVLEAVITRENGFAGRVPIDVKNLPFGVRILDVGLNGVLITESEASRRFTLLCEPWVQPGERLIYCTVRTETASSAPTEVAAEPIRLCIINR